MTLAQVDLSQVQDLVDPGVTIGDVFVGLGVLLAGILLAFGLRRLSARRLGRFEIGRSRSAQVLVLILQVFVILMAVIVGLDFLGVNLTPAVIALVFGLAVLFIASRDVVADFGAGLVLQAKSPIRVGEVATLDGVTGRIDEIDERVVRLETIEGDIVSIPNSTVLNGRIHNLSRAGVRNTLIPVPVAYGTELERARESIEAAVAGCELVRSEPAPEIYLEGLGASSVDFRVRVWHRAGPIEQMAAVDQVLSSVYSRFEADGIEIPLPQRVLHWAAEQAPQPDGRP